MENNYLTKKKNAELCQVCEYLVNLRNNIYKI